MIDTAEPVSNSILSGLPSTSRSTQIISLLCFLTDCVPRRWLISLHMHQHQHQRQQHVPLGFWLLA